MNQSTADASRCAVVGADRLPPDVGPGMICDAINAAVARAAPGALQRVEVTVLSSSSLAALVTMADGRVLPEQKMGVSDRQLNSGSIERFAAAVAAAIAGSGRQ